MDWHDDIMGELRTLSQEPSLAHFEEIAEWVESIDDIEAREQKVLPYLASRMSTWPHAMCRAPQSWFERYRTSREMHPAWKLVRSLERPEGIFGPEELCKLVHRAPLRNLRALLWPRRGRGCSLENDHVEAIVRAQHQPLVELDLRGHDALDNAFPWGAIDRGQMERLAISETSIAPTMAGLGSWSVLRELDVSCSEGVSMHRLCAPWRFPALESLRLSLSRGDVQPAWFSDDLFARLRKLDLMSSIEGAVGFGRLAAGRNLESLTLRRYWRPYRPSDDVADLDHVIPELSDLRELALWKFHFYGNPSKRLGLERLERFVFWGEAQEHLALHFLEELPSGLRELRCSGLMVPRGEPLSVLGRFHALEELTLEECGLSNAVLPTLSLLGCAGLRKLNLAGNSLGDAALARMLRMAHWPQLEVLDLGATGAGDLVAQAIADAPWRLRELNLAVSRRSIGPEGIPGALGEMGLQALAYAESLTELEVLELTGHYVSYGQGSTILARSPFLPPRITAQWS